MLCGYARQLNVFAKCTLSILRYNLRCKLVYSTVDCAPSKYKFITSYCSIFLNDIACCANYVL